MVTYSVWRLFHLMANKYLLMSSLDLVFFASCSLSLFYTLFELDLMTFIKTFAPLLLLYSLASASTCYFSDGSIATGSFACNNSTEFSACCVLHQEDGTPSDLCTTNGLCLSRSGTYNGFLFQSSCTDPTWQSSSCPQACPCMLL